MLCSFNGASLDLAGLTCAFCTQLCRGSPSLVLESEVASVIWRDDCGIIGSCVKLFCEFESCKLVWGDVEVANKYLSHGEPRKQSSKRRPK